MLLRCVLLLVPFFLLLPTASSAGMTWQIQTVDADGDTGFKPSIAIDSDGIPHVVYIDRTQGHFIHAKKTGPNDWIEDLGPLADERMEPGLIFLPGNIPAFTVGGIFYVKTDQGWQLEDMGTYGFWCSAVALAPNGDVEGIAQGSWGSGSYIGWVDGSVRRNGVWGGQAELATAVFYPNSVSESIVVDANGNPHASFTSNGGEPLQYGVRAYGVWSVVDLPVGLWSSIALDAQGAPRISFTAFPSQELAMSTRSQGVWVTTYLDAPGETSEHTSHVIRNDVSYVTYYEPTRGDLRLAMFTPTNFMPPTDIDVEGDVGAWPSLAVDATGRLHVAYYDVTNGDLKYALGEYTLPTRSATLGQIKSMYRR